jgi:hypothetical protein
VQGSAAARGAWCWEREGKDRVTKVARVVIVLYETGLHVLGRFWAGPNVDETSCAAPGAC